MNDDRDKRRHFIGNNASEQTCTNVKVRGNDYLPVASLASVSGEYTGPVRAYPVTGESPVYLLRVVYMRVRVS
jgi:hypothetical protein